MQSIVGSLNEHQNNLQVKSLQHAFQMLAFCLSDYEEVLVMSRMFIVIILKTQRIRGLQSQSAS